MIANNNTPMARCPLADNPAGCGMSANAAIAVAATASQSQRIFVEFTGASVGALRSSRQRANSFIACE